MSVFSRVDEAIAQLKEAFDAIRGGRSGGTERVQRIARLVRSLCAWDEDAALAAVHLFKREAGTPQLAIFYAILCEVLGVDFNYRSDRRESLVCAALTANVGFTAQEALNRQPDALTDEQLTTVHAHPEASATLLRECGVEDEFWLAMVEQHHERGDGTGYPRGLKLEEINPGARLIHLAEAYCAGITVRAYRRKQLGKTHVHPTTALLEAHRYEEEHARRMLTTFIRALGVYPPGCWVRLANKEIGLVTRRGKKSGSTPVVESFIGSSGVPFPDPMTRDTSQERWKITGIAEEPASRLKIHMSQLWERG